MSNTYSYGQPPARSLSRVAQAGPSPATNFRVRLLSAVNSMPPMPNALSRLLGMLNDENCSAGQIAQVIESDSVLSGSVLRCVNSAYYGLPGRVSAVRQAVTLLGFSTVRNLALAFSMRRMISRNQPSPERYAAYSRHALGVAIMTQFLAHFTRARDPEAAFAAGLFHDIGRLLILSNAEEAVPEILRVWEEGDGDLERAERQVLEVTHAELSASILEGWRLPESVQVAVRYHHHPDDAPSVEDPSDSANDGPSLAALTHAADLAVNFEGIQTLTAPSHPPESPASALAAVGCGSDTDQILEQFRTEFGSLQGVFQ